MRTQPVPPDTLIIAADIGKNVHWFGCYDDRHTELVAPRKVRSHQPGFAEFTAVVDLLLASGRFRAAVLGHEVTGVYHEPWAWLIQAHYQAWLGPESACPLTYRWLNPLLTKKRQEQLALRPRSTDRTAVAAVADCLADGLGHPPHLYTGAAAQLREFVRTWEQLHRQQRHLARQLVPQMDRLWPGAIANVKQFRAAHPELEPPLPIVQTKALDRDRVAALLLHYPNPHDVLDLDPAALQAHLREHAGRAGPKTVQAILTMLQQAPLPPRDLADLYAQRLQTDYQAYTDLSTRLTDLVADIEALVATTDARFLDSVPGISPLLAARYLVAIGQAAYYQTAAQIWALAGYDLVTAESGDTKRLGHITKRGSPAFRDALYQIGYHTASQCPPIGHTYLAARERGLSEVGAVIHAAHKANRLCFTLLTEQRDYRPVAAEEQDQFRARWQRAHKKHRRRRPQRIAA
ncbi:MAG: transposase [Chloroflexi bacterium]|nr:transposase [Chloroflexota bacterium]